MICAEDRPTINHGRWPMISAPASSHAVNGRWPRIRPIGGEGAANISTLPSKLGGEKVVYDATKKIFSSSSGLAEDILFLFTDWLSLLREIVNIETRIVILMWTGNSVTRPFRVAGTDTLAPGYQQRLEKHSGET
ncbi:hypothetical protein ZEAMMB73_Zm00001d002437 [Zea mays]|uniref:Uncharacterized protein n=1 Tax=Zea mays TaxID=4577 RepID=A0A1D6E0Q7_MAIZE|nr:hypothetical protein ZEAMMB73_Zm00001d002437 [Zea mays]